MLANLLVILRSLPRRVLDEGPAGGAAVLNHASHVVLQLGFGRRRPGHGWIARSCGSKKENGIAVMEALNNLLRRAEERC